MKRVKIGRLEDFPREAIRGVEAEDRKIIVVNLEGELHALDGICTHAYAELQNGFLGGGLVTCPLHLSRFDVETGEATNPPAEEPLRRYEVEVEDGVVYLLLE
ncbi:MAG: Rieske (2Fe-2S) protein [Thermoplasmata archaeon]